MRLIETGFRVVPYILAAALVAPLAVLVKWGLQVLLAVPSPCALPTRIVLTLASVIIASLAAAVSFVIICLGGAVFISATRKLMGAIWAIAATLRTSKRIAK
jgi:hypothetical protein